MAFRSAAGTPTAYTLTTDETAALKAVAQGSGFTGKSAAAIALALNTPTTSPNPKPVAMIDKVTVDKQNVQALILTVLVTLKSENPVRDNLVDLWGLISDKVDSMHTSVFLTADLAQWCAMAVQQQIISQGMADGLVSNPDPAWSATVTVSPLAWTMFTEPTYIEEADVTTAIAS